MPDDDDDAKTSEKTFTRSEVRAMIAAEMRKVQEKYADYDELKAAAATADKSKSQLDKIQEQLTAMQSRAERAEAATLRRDVADELGLTARQAGRLKGSTREELLADGREYMEDNGIKPKGEREAPPAGDGAAQDGKEVESGTNGSDADLPRRGSGRPRETLHSGAPMSAGAPTETDPMKLAALVPRR